MAMKALAKTPSERRRKDRERVEFAGSIRQGRGREVLCVIWDVSRTGARLVVPSAAALPDRFMLTLKRRTPVKHQCDVMWRTECQVGVAFAD